MPPNDISIIIVSWNARSYLVDCLESIRATAAGLNYEVFVVDNASHDGSPEAVEKLFPEVRLIRTGSNLGFAKANNVAIRQASGRYFCLVNSDVVVKPDCFQRLFRFMEENQDVGLAGPRLLNGDGTFQSSCRRAPTLMTHLSRALFINTSVADPAYKGSEVKPVGVLAGSFWIARRSAVEKVGLLDESFFFYGEDHDWCHRFHLGGWKVCFFPGAEAIHFGGASSSADPFRFNLELQKAVLQHWEKYHSQSSTRLYLLIGILYHGLRSGIRTVRLCIPVGNRTGARAKWDQHFVSLKWLVRAFLQRLQTGRSVTVSPASTPQPAPTELAIK